MDSSVQNPKEGGNVRNTTGRTRDGHDIEVRHADHYRDDTVIVDGQQRTVVRADRFRDGGTTVYHLEDGTLTLPHRMGNPDRTPVWRPK